MLVHIDIRLRGLKRRVRRIKRYVKKQRTRNIVLLYKTHRFISNQAGCVALFAQRLVITVPVQPTITNMSKVIECTVVVTVLMVKTARGRQVLRA